MSSRLTQLAAAIAADTAIIDAYLAAHALPPPSFAPDGPPDFPIAPGASKDETKEAQEARRRVLIASKEMHDLMVGPRESVRWLGWSYNDNLTMHVIYHFKIAQAVPLDAPIALDALSERVNLDKVNLARILRHALTLRLFLEPSPGVFAHSAASRVLHDDPAMADWVGFCSADCFPAAARTVDALHRWPASGEPTETGFSLAWDTPLPIFQVLGADPARAARFGRAMVSLTAGEGYEVRHVVEGYDWANVGNGEGLVVDVGGSHGFVDVALAARYAGLRFVLQDLQKTVDSARAHVPKDLLASGRIVLQAHDFFDEQPVKGADVYLFRWIFHNWSDAYCVRILRALVPALKKGARVVINENTLPAHGAEDAWDERIIRSMDLTMLQLLNARERGAEDYAALFQRADGRFVFRGIKRPEGCRMGIVEAVWEGDEEE